MPCDGPRLGWPAAQSRKRVLSTRRSQVQFFRFAFSDCFR